MNEDSRNLLTTWVDAVMSRPNHPCGIFTGDDGQPNGTRSRPWDEPDLLISTRLLDDGIELVFDSYGVKSAWAIEPITSVERADHPWGTALRVMTLSNGVPREVWLV